MVAVQIMEGKRGPKKPVASKNDILLKGEILEKFH